MMVVRLNVPMFEVGMPYFFATARANRSPALPDTPKSVAYAFLLPVK